MNELQILFPTSTRVKVGRRWVSIRAVEFRNFDEFGTASAELLALLAKGDLAMVYSWSKRAEVVQAVLANCTNLSKWRIARLPVTVGVELMLHVIALNSRFFEQALVNATVLLAGATSPKS